MRSVKSLNGVVTDSSIATNLTFLFQGSEILVELWIGVTHDYSLISIFHFYYISQLVHVLWLVNLAGCTLLYGSSSNMKCVCIPGSIPSLAAGLAFGGISAVAAYQTNSYPRNAWVMLGKQYTCKFQSGLPPKCGGHQT